MLQNGGAGCHRRVLCTCAAVLHSIGCTARGSTGRRTKKETDCVPLDGSYKSAVAKQTLLIVGVSVWLNHFLPFYSCNL